MRRAARYTTIAPPTITGSLSSAENISTKNGSTAPASRPNTMGAGSHAERRCSRPVEPRASTTTPAITVAPINSAQRNSVPSLEMRISTKMFPVSMSGCRKRNASRSASTLGIP